MTDQVLKSFKSIFRDAGSFYIKYFSRFLCLTFAFLLPFLIVDRFFFNNASLKSQLIRYSSSFYKLFYGFVDIISVLYFLLYLVAAIKMVQALDENKYSNIQSVLRSANQSFLGYVHIKILTILKVLLWSLVFVVPGVIFGVFYSMSSLAFLVDGKKGAEALQFSRSIVRPSLGGVALDIFLVLVFLITLIFPPIYALDTLVEFFYIKDLLLFPEAIDALEILLIFMFVVFFLVYLYQLYKALRGRVLIRQ